MDSDAFFAQNSLFAGTDWYAFRRAHGDLLLLALPVVGRLEVTQADANTRASGRCRAQRHGEPAVDAVGVVYRRRGGDGASRSDPAQHVGPRRSLIAGDVNIKDRGAVVVELG